MRAIIIDDKDAQQMLRDLDLERLKASNCGRPPNMDGAHYYAMLEQIHAKFHYVVCRWLQDQGANVVR